MNIIDHAEKFLGKVAQGWKQKEISDGLQVLHFKNRPFESVDTYLTAGLSHHELSISAEKKVRQELIFSLSNGHISERIVSLMLNLCEQILKDHAALLRGQVIEFPEDIAEAMGFEAVYCTIPVFMTDDFTTCNDSMPPTVVVWIIPIYEAEVNYIIGNGWSKFEDLLEKKAPDLFCLNRKSIV